jgi:uncharacterized membrane protein
VEIDVVAWLGLALRWLHLITGIAWIGSSFYFIWLDNSLAPPESGEDKKAGVAGELWAVHGGGFYHKKKYGVAPEHMPEDLHWFKWEAYFTWLSGFLLLSLMYYYGANLYLIDRAKMDIGAAEAVLSGLGFIVGGWVFYDTLCKSSIGKNNKLFGCVWFVALTAAAYALNQIFTGRGAYIHVGAIIGTVMAANVFMVIIPNQKKVVKALLAGEKPDARLGLQAKQRSVHNNYMTLPVLLIMISNHYPMLFGNAYNWLILAGLGASVWPIRQFFVLRHKGKVNYWYPAAGIAGFIAVMLFASGGTRPVATEEKVSAAEVRDIIRTHCSSCHSDTPTHKGITAAPAGVMFDKMDEIRKYAARIYEQAVEHDTMPLGNETGMTPAERQKLGAGLSQTEEKK